MASEPKALKHGRASTYNNDGCRCQECKTAWADYMRPRIKKYRAKKRAANPTER